MQSIGYATLAKLDPQYGLCKCFSLFIDSEFLINVNCELRPNFLFYPDTSVVPPLIYAFMGSSREIAIGPVAVISLLLSSMVQKLEDPEANPLAYTKLVITVTFFAGIFQAGFGLLRLNLFSSFKLPNYKITFFTSNIFLFFIFV